MTFFRRAKTFSFRVFFSQSLEFFRLSPSQRSLRHLGSLGRREEKIEPSWDPPGDELEYRSNEYCPDRIHCCWFYTLTFHSLTHTHTHILTYSLTHTHPNSLTHTLKRTLTFLINQQMHWNIGDCLDRIWLRTTHLIVTPCIPTRANMFISKG